MSKAPELRILSLDILGESNKINSIKMEESANEASGAESDGEAEAGEKGMSRNQRTVRIKSKYKCYKSRKGSFSAPKSEDLIEDIDSRSSIEMVDTSNEEKKMICPASEIILSERTYFNDLKAMEEFTEKIKREKTISDEKLSKIFSNLPEILKLSATLLLEFEERMNNWGSLQKISDILVRHGPRLKIYAKYLSDYNSSLKQLTKSRAKYPQFDKAVKDFEVQSKGLKLIVVMLAPVQRLPRYKMLLEAYLSSLKGLTGDVDDTKEAIEIVSNVTREVNNNLGHCEKKERMLELEELLVGYELVQAQKFRLLLKDGMMTKTAWNEASIPWYFILVTDAFLCTNFIQVNRITTSRLMFQDFYGRLKLRYVIRLTELTLSVPESQNLQNEFIIETEGTSLCLRAPSEDDRNDWIEAIEAAQKKFNDSATADEENNLWSIKNDNLGDAKPVKFPEKMCKFCQVGSKS